MFSTPFPAPAASWAPMPAASPGARPVATVPGAEQALAAQQQRPRAGSPRPEASSGAPTMPTLYAVTTQAYVPALAWNPWRTRKMSAALSSEANPTLGSSIIAMARATGLRQTSPRPSRACPRSVTGRPAPLRSAQAELPRRHPGGRRGIPSVSAAESTKVPALTISASPGPPAASRIPPSAGPRASAAFEPVASSALAAVRLSRPAI